MSTAEGVRIFMMMKTIRMFSRTLVVLSLLVVALVTLPTFAAATHTPLPADQAFTFTTKLDGPNKVLVLWHVAPGYYLYREHMKIDVTTKVATDIQYPQGELKYYDDGRQEVYSGDFSIPITLKQSVPTLSLIINYQGCSSEGFCYPPMYENVTLNLNNLDNLHSPVSHARADSDKNIASFAPWHLLQSLLTDQYGVQSLLSTQHLGMMLLLFLGLGLLLAFTPCVLPMVPILTSIIVGQKQTVTTKKAFWLSFAYVFGSAVTYALAGLMAAYLGHSLQVWLQKPAMIGMASLVFVLLSLSLFGLYDFRLPQQWQNIIFKLSRKQQGGAYASVFFMGILSTLVVSPCVTAPLVGVLLYIGQTGDLALGASALFVMGIGMGLPLLLIGSTAGKWLPKSGPWMEIVKKSFGLLMLGMAVWLLSRIFSMTSMLLCFGFLLAGLALFFALFLPAKVVWHKLYRSLGIMVGCSGMLFIIGIGGMNTPNHMMNWMLNSASPVSSSFLLVRDVPDFKKQLSIAKAAKQPVILDFYADWCESCIEMDKKVFNIPDVKKELSHYILLRADLSANTEADGRLLKQFAVVAPPTVLFFDANGDEMTTQRIVGEVSAKEFLARLGHF